MRPLRRSAVRKSSSARAFRRSAGRTNGLNVRPMRGGWRL